MPATITFKTTGKILVSEGKTVSEGEIIAQDEHILQLVSVNLAKLLSISPKKCKKFLLKDLGKEIKISEIIAGKKAFLGLKKKTVKAPCDGVLERLEIETGELIISLPKEVCEVKSPVNGKVKKVAKNEVVILVTGEEINLTKAIGNFTKGKIVIISEEKADLFSIDCKVNQKIVCGRVLTQAFLEKALAIGVAAVIAIETPDCNFEEIERGKKIAIGKIEEKIILNLGLIKEEDFKTLERNKEKVAIFDPKGKKLIITDINE